VKRFVDLLEYIMKICLINNLYKPYNRGGAENIVEMIARGLVKAGHDVFVITTKPFTQKHKNTKTQSLSSTPIREHKIYYVNSLYYNLNKLPKFLRLFWHLIDVFDVGSYFQVKRILKIEKPAVVMTHNLKGAGYLIPRAIKKLKIKHIHTLHDIQLLHPSGLMIYKKEKAIDSLFSKIYAWPCCLLFGNPDVVISPSDWLMKMHEDRGFFAKSEKIILPNPVEAITADLNIAKRKSDEVFRFFYAGQIEEHKGVLFLINAFRKLKDHCELIIAGGGVKLNQAKKLARDNKNIKFIGRIGKSEVLDMMKRADALIMPSLCYENSPAVMYEALAAGLPVIASRIGGAEELVRNAAGILFEPSNEKDLIDKIKFARENREKLFNISQKGLEKIKRFGIDNYVNRLVNLL